MAGTLQFIKKLHDEACSYWPGENRRATHYAITGIQPENKIPTSTINIARMTRPTRLDGVKSGFMAASFGVTAPACISCNSCIPLRVNTDKFQLSRSQNRLLRQAGFSYDLSQTVLLNPAELYRVFKIYTSTRHSEKESLMHKWSYSQFNDWLRFMPFMATLRDSNRKLLGFTAMEAQGNSAILEYIAYDPLYSNLSLGKRLWLKTMEDGKSSGVEHVYVGAWAKDSPKLNYKAQHSGLETYVFDEQTGVGKWVDFDPDVHIRGPNYRAMLKAEGFHI